MKGKQAPESSPEAPGPTPRSPQTLQRLYPCVSSLNRSLTVLVPAQPPAADPFIESPGRWNTLSFLMFDDHCLFRHAYTYNPIRFFKKNPKKQNESFYFTLICCMWRCDVAALIRRAESAVIRRQRSSLNTKKSNTLIEEAAWFMNMLLPVLSLEMFLNKAVSVSRLLRAGWAETGRMLQWSGSLQIWRKIILS